MFLSSFAIVGPFGPSISPAVMLTPARGLPAGYFTRRIIIDRKPEMFLKSLQVDGYRIRSLGSGVIHRQFSYEI